MPFGLGDQLGIPMPGYRFRVVDEDGDEVRVGAVGQLLLRGPGVLEGYWNDSAATEAVLDAGGWLSTGDLVRRGPMGTFSFQGRAKVVIKSGGFSVYPPEVERVFEQHPDVVEAGVVGLPDDTLGEVPVVGLRMAKGATSTPDELLSWVGERLSTYKVPRRVYFVDDLPRTGTNKLQRDELIERLLDLD